MEKAIYGNLTSVGIEVVCRGGQYYVRYDAGAHQIAWREDEISASELEQVQLSEAAAHKALLGLQRRLEAAGINPYTSNWSPELKP